MTYLQKPSNINFYNWYRAEELGAAAFAAPAANFGEEFDDIPAETKGFELRKRFAGMITFHQMLQEAMGIEHTLLGKGLFALERLGQEPTFGQWKTANPFHGLGDDTGRPSAVRSDRLSYPPRSCRTFGGRL